MSELSSGSDKTAIVTRSKIRISPLKIHSTSNDSDSDDLKIKKNLKGTKR